MNTSTGNAETKNIGTVSFKVTVCEDSATILEELNQEFPVIIPKGEFAQEFWRQTADTLHATLANGRPLGYITFPNDDGNASKNMATLIQKHELIFRNQKGLRLAFDIDAVPNGTLSGIVIIQRDPILPPYRSPQEEMDSYLTILSAYWQTH